MGGRVRGCWGRCLYGECEANGARRLEEREGRKVQARVRVRKGYQRGYVLTWAFGIGVTTCSGYLVGIRVEEMETGRRTGMLRWRSEYSHRDDEL